MDERAKRLASLARGSAAGAAALAFSAVALAQAVSVEVESAAGGIDREQAQTVLSALSEPLGACFEEPASVLATLRVNRSGAVTSVRLMELSGNDAVDRCVSRALRRARFERASGRSTVYVRIRRE